MFGRPHGYTTLPYSEFRRALEAMLRSAATATMVHGLAEFDVTEARRLIARRQRETGDRPSFAAFIVHCLARAIEENKSMQACRKGRRHLVVFDDVDVSIVVEREHHGGKQPIIHIVRAANRKTFEEIHREIREAQKEPLETAWNGFTTYGTVELVLLRWLWPVLWRFVRTSPHLHKRYGGTVSVSSLGMFAQGGGWGFPITYHTQLTVGGIAQKPVLVNGRVKAREMVDLTLSFDHALIEGAQAARFSARLKELVEGAYGLQPPQLKSSPDVEVPAAATTGDGNMAGAAQHK